MQFDGGYASDQGRKLGTASFAMAMLDEGTRSLDALQIAELGARGKPPMPEQITDLLERRAFREIVDVVAAVGEDAAHLVLTGAQAHLRFSLTTKGTGARRTVY